jgi:hypothetical protein
VEAGQVQEHALVDASAVGNAHVLFPSLLVIVPPVGGRQ